MRSEIDAVAFDIDGTLYSNWSFYRHLFPFIIQNSRFLIKFGHVRKAIRRWQNAHPGEAHENFLDWQALLLSEYLECDAKDARLALDEKIYVGWKPLFAKIAPFPYVREAFLAIKESGLKIALLSDFLPSQKGDLWGLAPLCDVILGSEETGALKPSPVPFSALSEALAIPFSRIVYVGNSMASDIRGAAAVGMKTAHIVHPLMLPFSQRLRAADISFSDYRQLTANVLE